MPRWSDDILREVRSTLLKFNKTECQADRRVSALRSAFPEALVTGYERLIDSMPNDEKDRHVLAAAVVARADVIVTDNLRHFLEGDLISYGIAAQSADQFLLHQYNIDPDLFIGILTQQAADSKRSLKDLLRLLSLRTPKLALQMKL